MDPTYLIDCLDRSLHDLANSESALKLWPQIGYRTHFMTGHAVKRNPAFRSSSYPVVASMIRLLQRRYNNDEAVIHALRESHRLDLICFEVPKFNDLDSARKCWDRACWGAKPGPADTVSIACYQPRLVLEVENNIKEFEMTVRLMMTVRSPFYCGLFYCKPGTPPDDILIGNSRSRGEYIRFGEWKPPWHKDRGRWRLDAAASTQLLIAFISEEMPELVGWRLFDSEGNRENTQSAAVPIS